MEKLGVSTSSSDPGRSLEDHPGRGPAAVARQRAEAERADGAPIPQGGYRWMWRLQGKLSGQPREGRVAAPGHGEAQAVYGLRGPSRHQKSEKNMSAKTELYDFVNFTLFRVIKRRLQSVLLIRLILYYFLGWTA